jgi:hypothetical protein
MNHLWRWKAFTIPGRSPLMALAGLPGDPFFTIPGSYKPGMAFDSSLAAHLVPLLGMLLVICAKNKNKIILTLVGAITTDS